MGRRLVSLAALALCTLAALAADARAGSADVSSNWAGYAVVPRPAAPASFTHVAASWVQPTATCTAGSPTVSAFWVGLGGYGAQSQALEQAGTAADCDEAGTQRHYAWYELLPAPPVTVSLRVVAGDTVSATVDVAGTIVTVRIANLTQRTSFVKRLTMREPDLSSAEWIAETPSACSRWGHCRTLPLTDFGTIRFTRASAIADGHAGTIADPAWSRVAVRLSGSHDGFSPFFAHRRRRSAGADAKPTALAGGGGAFSVSVKQATPPTPPADGSSGPLVE